jgi:hypothetical protein
LVSHGVSTPAMSTTLTKTPSAPTPPPSDSDLDSELAALPAPPRTRVRVLGALLGAISLVSVGLAAQLRDDVAFAFAPAAPVVLGDAATAAVPSALANRMVTFRVTPQMAGAVRYTRPLTMGDYLVFPVAGRAGEAIYVQVDGAAVHAGQVTGRLVPFSGAGGRYNRVGRFLRDEMSGRVSGQTMLLVSDARPSQYLWAPALASFLLALALFDLVMLARLFRRVEE